jgi:hypothetical protein
MKLALFVATIFIPCAIESAEKTQTPISEIKIQTLTGSSSIQYELTIRNDGTVEYYGGNSANEKGWRRSYFS